MLGYSRLLDKRASWLRAVVVIFIAANAEKIYSFLIMHVVIIQIDHYCNHSTHMGTAWGLALRVRSMLAKYRHTPGRL